jgi:hypothetical protein
MVFAAAWRNAYHTVGINQYFTELLPLESNHGNDWLMGTRSSTPDLFSLASSREPSSSSANPPSSSPAITRISSGHVLPADLSNAIKQLGDQELDRLLAAVLAEQKRRGKKLRVSDENSRKRRVEAIAVPLTQGKLNAVRAAFKAGVTPSRIARQFGISQSDVRKALVGDGWKPLKITCYGTKQTSRCARSMSALRGKADIGWRRLIARVPLQSRCALRIWDLPAPTLEPAKAIALLSIRMKRCATNDAWADARLSLDQATINGHRARALVDIARSYAVSHSTISRLAGFEVAWDQNL